MTVSATSAPVKTDRLKIAYWSRWRPPPRLSVPDWADRFRRLAKGAGSTSGHWRTDRVEIGRGPMLAATEPGVRTITVMVATQLLKTSLIENIFGYHAHLDPCPMLIVQPKEDAAEQFSKERITPMIRATPVLNKLIGTMRTRSAEETLTYKGFTGGFLVLTGAGSPDNLSRRPIRLVFYDEVDKYPVTREGDPIRLGDERLATFVDRLSVRACSPTVEDQSRIAASYGESDQRRASVACPHCTHRQFLDFFAHVNWEKDGDQHRPETAHVYCEACGAAWSEGERLRALQTIRWHQTKPFTCCGERQVPLDEYVKGWRAAPDGAVELVWHWWAADRHAVYLAKCRTCGRHAVSNAHAGFQASKLYSPWPADEPAAIAGKWLTAKNDEDQKQAWWNTQLGLPYRPYAGKEIHIDALARRGEVWGAEVPDGVGIVTVGIDVQDDRVEAEVVGWGRDEESWSIAHEVIEGDPERPSFWNGVDDFLKRIWVRADGRPFEAAAACIDSGFHTQLVYNFAKDRIGRRIWAIKGESASSGQRSPVWPTKRPTSRTKKSYRPIILGVNAAKDSIRARLQIEQPGPGYMHFPADRDRNYFAQITAERSVVKFVNGQRFRVWELPPGRANEALDCRVYAYAALCGLMHFGVRLNRRVDEVTAIIGPTLPPARPAVPPATPRRKSLASMLAH